MTFLVVVLNTQSKTAKLTIPTHPPTQPFLAQQKNSKKLTSCSAWGALTTYPYKLRQKHFSRPGGGGARVPSAPPA